MSNFREVSRTGNTVAEELQQKPFKTEEEQNYEDMVMDEKDEGRREER
ncbi:MAG: hypothetical protein ABFC84_16840 [Veillonellales bacterium]